MFCINVSTKAIPIKLEFFCKYFATPAAQKLFVNEGSLLRKQHNQIFPRQKDNRQKR